MRKIYTAVCLMLFLIPLVFSDECTDIKQQLDMERTERQISEANLKAQIEMQNNQTRAYVESKANALVINQDANTKTTIDYLTNVIKNETAPYKMVIPIALTSIAIICGSLLVRVLEG